MDFFRENRQELLVTYGESFLSTYCTFRYIQSTKKSIPLHVLKKHTEKPQSAITLQRQMKWKLKRRNFENKIVIIWTQSGLWSCEYNVSSSN
jgi:hypothetical protein